MEFYHVLNRGVEKRKIVLGDKDRARFIHDLWAFNDANASSNFLHHARHEQLVDRDPLVYMHAFCLMDNHYHLLLSERKDRGISLFMQKLNMGYAKYFNEKYERVGTLWQGKYKKILIKRDAHFMYIPYYIHLNPLDRSFAEWRDGKIKNPKRALAALREYRWSSHLDYLGIKNFPSLTHRTEILGLTPTAYEREIASIISDLDISAGSLIIE
jgi:putative transposase